MPTDTPNLKPEGGSVGKGHSVLYANVVFEASTLLMILQGVIVAHKHTSTQVYANEIPTRENGTICSDRQRKLPGRLGKLGRRDWEEVGTRIHERTFEINRTYKNSPIFRSISY